MAFPTSNNLYLLPPHVIVLVLRLLSNIGSAQVSLVNQAIIVSILDPLDHSIEIKYLI